MIAQRSGFEASALQAWLSAPGERLRSGSANCQLRPPNSRNGFGLGFTSWKRTPKPRSAKSPQQAAKATGHRLIVDVI
jgi:hypothetical protein